MHNLKNYKKFIKTIEKDKSFDISSNGRRNSVKIVHNETKECRTVHPGEKAIEPLRKWVLKFK